MATNEILQFAASASGTDILTQANYTTDTDRTIGHQVGTARNDLENKVLKQVSLIAAGVAQFMADRQSNSITDSLTAAQIAEYLETALHDYVAPVTTATGTADALVATFAAPIDALDNRTIVVRAINANATTTPTINVDGLGVKTIVKGNNQPLRAGDIAGAGHYLILNYDTSLGKYVLANPYPSAAGTAIMVVRDEKASGTDGGTFTNGAWRTRTLNTEAHNTISGASLSANRITLPAGTYRIRASAPAHDVNNHKCKLVGISGDTGELLIGTTENTTGSASDEILTTTRSIIDGVLTLTQTTVLELQHRCQNTKNKHGFGRAASFGVVEVYATVTIEQI